jgi:hypothetical protein
VKPLLLILAALAMSAQTVAEWPVLVADGEFALPKDYRQWDLPEFLASK